MNYLGHAFLSFNDPGVLVGNLIGDHVKGRLALASYPEAVRKGILLHRKIDEEADRHPATIRAKLLFREDFGLYAGAIMDTLYDHFLANDPKYFPTQEALAHFSKGVYEHVDGFTEHFPERFAMYYPYMKKENWLLNYRSMAGIKQSLHGLARRAKHMPPIDKAYTIFVTGYYQLNHCYFDFIEDIVRFAKAEIG